MTMAAQQHSNEWRGVLEAVSGENGFSLLQDISPQDLANSFTYLDVRSFERLSTTDIVDHKHLVQDIRAAWDKLCSKVMASVVSSDYTLSEHFVTTITRLMALRNYNSATAILAGLRAGGVNHKDLPCLALLDPADNYGIYRAVFSNAPGLPFVPPHTEELTLASITVSLPDLSQCIQLLREQGIVVEKRGILYRAGLLTKSTAVTNAHSPDSSEYHLHLPRQGPMSADELCPNASARTPSQAIPTLLPLRPLRPHVFKTAVYKSVGDIPINVDIYMPKIRRGARTPIMLYIHGGGWVGGNRTDCSRLVLTRFLQQGFVVCSMDYRLLPESTFIEMQEDLRDIEPWLRQKLQAEVGENASIDNKKIVVVGASSGALLALQTPKYWVDSPTVIVSLYGPTNLQNMPSRGRFSTHDLPQIIDILLSSAFNFSHPPTEKPLPTTEECQNNPRTMLFRRLYREESLLQLLLGDVKKDDNGKLVLLMNKPIDPWKMAEINPVDLCNVLRYPTMCQIMGEDDELFQTSHVTELHEALTRQGVRSKYLLVPRVGHAFDTLAEEGGVEDESLNEAVLWVTRIVPVEGSSKRSIRVMGQATGAWRQQKCTQSNMNVEIDAPQFPLQMVPTALTPTFPPQHMAPRSSSSDVLPNGDLESLTSAIWRGQLPEHLQVVVAYQQGVICSTVSHSLFPPHDLLVHEKLLCNIKNYFEMSCRSMKFDNYGDLLTPYGANLINDFDSYCFTATVFKGKGLLVEFRRALSKACALVEEIIRTEHPRTLACFLEVLIHFIQTGLPDIAPFLCRLIQATSAQVHKEGLWSQICQLLGKSNSESSGQAMAQAWKLMTDTFDSELGASSRLAVSVRLDYIKRIYGATNYPEEEVLLRRLLPFGAPELSTPRVMLNLAHNLSRQGLHNEAEEMALEVQLLLGQHGIYARRVVEKIECLKIISHSQFNQGNKAAEQTMQMAIQMIEEQWGMHHSWVPEFKNVLEGWLRGWGRVADADILLGEIEKLVGEDEIDKLDQSS
ncbi:hypothetical protein V498_02404 [Pseudogymnoascus sp. VKM F-4517 (FW-2822)]|nr:hypothetical protein V498_02404 [Pseudogymnoascus sp. VKM F-4517 (FW-2822)]